MSSLSLLIISIAATAAFAGVIPEHYPHEYAYAPAHIALPPAISTFSFISLNPHKPTSYSGFTNHGRGHHDPGYAVQFRQDGYALPHHHPEPIHHHIAEPISHHIPEPIHHHIPHSYY